MEDLKRFLVQLPRKSGFKDNKNLKKSLYKALYYAITEEGKYLNLLFRGVHEAEIDPWSYISNETKPFYEYVIPEEYTHPSSQVCGRVLGSREKVYRCADCGYDDTCVICSFCFRREDHEGHNVTVYLSEANGGMCDCGDETAFVRKLNCACSSDNFKKCKLSRNFKSAIRATIQTVLDYVLDVTNFSINTLPFIHKNINGQGGLEITSQHISELGSLPKDVYVADDINTEDKWYLILWNDEDHDYPEAETGIRAATDMDENKAKHVADEINHKGRAVLKESSSYADLLESQKAAQSDGLVATISTARDYMRESIIFQIFNWLKDIISFKGNSSFREAVKEALAQVLLEPGFSLSKPIPSEFLKSNSLDVLNECMINGIPLNGEFSNSEISKLKPGTKLADLGQPLKNIMIQETSTKLVKSRILYLLAFEIRFVSAIRKRFTRSILPVLFIDPQTKATFCDQYVNSYPMLMSILAFSDREEELASSNDISVQLFTCPRTNKWIIESANFAKLLYPLCKLIEDQSSSINEEGFPNLVDIVFDIRSKREKSSIQKTVKMGIQNITRVVTKNDEENLLNYIMAQENLPLFLSFLKYFQGFSPLTRKVGDHVERESLTEFYSFISKAIPISGIVFHATRVVQMNYITAKDAIQTTVRYLQSRKSIKSRYPDAQFQVSTHPVSPFNPINSFLSFVLQEAGFDFVRDFLCESETKFLSISDFSLRNIVLVNQVKIGLWIRNGQTVARQVRYLLDSSADVTYWRDLHLNQVSAIVDQPEDVLIAFLERWELHEWFSGCIDHEKTVYEQKFMFICERLISFLYKLLVDRRHFDKEMADSSNDESIRKAICYDLCEEPKTYSNLKKSLPLYVSRSDSFDRILKECAEFQAPVGIYDVGIYRLKSSVYEELDPMGQTDGETSQSIFEALFTMIAKHENNDLKKVILMPKIGHSNNSFVNTKIGAIFRTKIFAKLVYKLLQVGIDTGDEEYLPHLLHLLHATILDGELVYGKNYLEKCLVSIPICNLLLTIAESSMSASIISKADYLLDQFLSRDGSVMDSLLDCFGEAHIESYKYRKEKSSDSKRQKSAKLAQNRKAKILKKFAKQREKFLENNAIFEDNTVLPSSGPEPPTPRTCVYCGEGESLEKPFGIPFRTSSGSIFWKLSSEDPALVNHAFSDYSKLFPVEANDIYSKGFPRDLCHTASLVSSCAHGAHVHCQERARFSSLFPSPCPLCHTLYDDVIPNFLHNAQFLNPSLFTRDPSNSDPTEIVANFDDQRNYDIMESVVDKGYFQENGSLRVEFSKQLCSVFKISKQNNGRSIEESDLSMLRKVENLIADTIKANEISMRIDGSEKNAFFIEEMPSTLKYLIRSLTQSRVLIYDIQKSRASDISNYFHHLQSYESDSIFNEVVSLFFSSSESLQTIIRLGFAKMVAITSITLCSEFDSFLSETSFPSGHPLDPESIKSAALYCENFLGILNIDFTSKSLSYFENFYLALERCLFPFLRQCAMLVDILLCKRSADSDFISDDRFKAMSKAFEQQNYNYSTTPLCQVLNVPILSDILRASRESTSLEFEVRVLKNYTEIDVLQSISDSVKTLDYPNVPRLINLPKDFNLSITDPKHASPSDMICLVCGKRLSTWSKSSHQIECSSLCLLFCPGENSVITSIVLGHNSFEIRIPGPYMTTHGEVKQATTSEKASLNHLRYAHLNKLWINQELFGFATRTMYGERMSPLEATDVPAEAFEDDSFDEFEFWE
ncbi:hypothetical protein JCM33374_g541 [Metschnikowia sp. JCM 33374]|nr:hypothetical protein JCM33374_g541 [Metschnikowia sp. JCM 33374]